MTRSWEGKTIRCVGRKCSRKATHGYRGVDRLPRFCVLHRLEGMFELGPWRPTFKMGDGDSAPRDVPPLKVLPTKPVTEDVSGTGEKERVQSTPTDLVEQGDEHANKTTPSCAIAKATDKGEKKKRGRPKIPAPSPRTTIKNFFSPPRHRIARV